MYPTSSPAAVNGSRTHAGRAPEPDVHRPLPHSIEAEKGLLSSLLLAPAEVCPLVLDLFPGSFYLPAHQTTFQLLLDRWRAGQPADFITLTQALRDCGQLDAVGGPAFVTELFTYVPTAVNASYYLDEVREKSGRRQIIAACNKSIEDAYRHDADPRDTVDHLVKRLPADPAAPRPGALPQIKDAAELLVDAENGSLKAPPEIVAGLLHQGSKLTLGGGSKSYKTWLLLDGALAVATGGEWLGFATTQGRVLYVNLELPAWSVTERLRVIAHARGLTMLPGLLDVWNLRGHAADVTELVPMMIERATAGNYSLIVLDPVYKMLGGRDENKAGDMAGLFNELERLTVQTGAAIATGAHFSKGNQASKESLDRFSGSGVIARDADALLTFTRHEQEDAFTLDATLRNLPPVAPFVVKWDFPRMVRDEAGLDPAKLKQVGGRPKAHAADELLGLLGHKELTTKEWEALALKEAGIRESTFHRLRRELSTLGRVQKSKLNGSWFKA